MSFTKQKQDAHTILRKVKSYMPDGDTTCTCDRDTCCFLGNVLNNPNLLNVWICTKFECTCKSDLIVHDHFEFAINLHVFIENFIILNLIFIH